MRLRPRQRSCVWADVGEKTETVLFITTRPNCPLSQNAGEATGWDCVTHWVHLSRKDPFDAQLDNGPYGAGHIVVHGYFAISLRQALGSAPPEVHHIFLRAVPPELAGQR